MAKLIFRKIGGRIVPIRGGKATAESTAIRKSLKKAASGRSSTALERQKAVRAARLSLDVKTRTVFGFGSFTTAFGALGKVVKTFRQGSRGRGFKLDDEDPVVRAARQIALGKRGTPTFLVRSKKTDFLVQQPIKTNPSEKAIERFRKDLLSKDVGAFDMKPSNFGKRRGRMAVVDAGAILTPHPGLPKLTKAQKAKLRRVTILSRRKK